MTVTGGERGGDGSPSRLCRIDSARAKPGLLLSNSCHITRISIRLCLTRDKSIMIMSVGNILTSINSVIFSIKSNVESYKEVLGI